MYYIKNRKKFTLYNKSLELYEILILNVKIYDENFYTLRKLMINIISNISASNGKEFYPKYKVNHYKKCIYKTYKVEELLNKDNLIHISKLIEIRKILFVLIKREEELMKSNSKKYIVPNLDYKNYISKDLKSLRAYQLGLIYVQECTKVVDSLPDYEEYIIKDQLRRSSQSVLSNISEGHGYSDLYYKKAISSYNIALGSLKESISQIDICKIHGYISKDTYDYLNYISNQIIALLVTYIRNICK